jgi:hypothetical protein
MHVLFDCDGVLSDTVGTLFRLLETDHTTDEICHWNFLELLEEWHGRYARIMAERTFDDPAFWAHLGELPGALEAVQAVRRAGAEVRVVTTPWPTCREWDYARREWLKRNFDIMPHEVWVGYAKEDLDGDILVEDKGATVLSWAAAHPGSVAFLYDQPWNQDVEYDRRLSWSPGREGVSDLSALLEACRRPA